MQVRFGLTVHTIGDDSPEVYRTIEQRQQPPKKPLTTKKIHLNRTIERREKGLLERQA